MTITGPILVSLAASLAGALPADFTLPPPPGPFVEVVKPSAVPSFRRGEPLVATTYFYWYDNATKAHVVDSDGSDALTDHPPTLEGFSYNNVDWHARQLTDMMAAGIDVALPVYWGEVDNPQTWSDRGLPKLVAARERLVAAGKRPPAIGMFYDTTTLSYHGGIDLTKPAGRQWFYGTIRNFFSLIPAKHRATIDGRPLVLLYAPGFATRIDAELFPATREMFRRDFGTDLYLVKMRGWPGPSDSEYQWGAALMPQILDTAGIGAGYDHSAVEGRTPLVRKREDGRFYRFGWQRLLSMDPAKRPWLVHLETWNEFHEGTDICESAEYGRKYIELTRQFADQFHARKRVDPAKDLTAPRVVGASPGKSPGVELVNQRDGDGPIVEKTIAGRRAWVTVPNRRSPDNRYMYFDVHYAFLFDGDEPLRVTIGYYDAGPSWFWGQLSEAQRKRVTTGQYDAAPTTFELQYDSSDPALAGLAQEFRVGGSQAIGGTKTWKEVTFEIPHARFANRANGGDFRLHCTGGDLAVSHVRLIRSPR